MCAMFSPPDPAPVISIDPGQLAKIQAGFAREWERISGQALAGSLQPPADRRFSAPAWVACQRSLLMAHAYLLSASALNQMVDAADMSPAARKRLQFSVMQWIDAASPANFLATNPDAQTTLLESNGKSLCLGLQNVFADITKGRLTQSDESRFQVGDNVAKTEGAVVFQNSLMQLIQYAPLTDQVHSIPLVIVPPCINKFYILDLQPENSFVRHAVQQGQTVFLVSWRNPLPQDTDGIHTATWGDYLQEGVLKALDIASTITKQRQVNALGFCVGGTLLSSALAWAKARGNDPVASLTLLTTLLDFSNTGVLDVFVDENHAGKRDKQFGAGGLMPARELGMTFSFLRPNELVWNYVINNYLKGMQPTAFDLLFWNSDGTNLPGPFFAWYFRNTYLENRLVQPGGVVIDGQAVVLSTLNMPAYVFGSQEDHIVPWHGAYASTGVLSGDIRYVLGSSGHVAGVINPPAKNRRSYWLHSTPLKAGQFPADPEQWLEGAQNYRGSWWPNWSAWLAEHAGPMIKARTTLGNTAYPPLQAAPGDYVKVRAV